MVFGFFSRKAAPPPEPAEAGPSALNAPSPAADAGPVVSPEFRFPPVKQQHTPAPSIDSAAAFTNQEADAQPAPKPKKPRAKPGPKPKPKPVVKETSPLITEIPAGPADTPSPGPEDALVTDPSALYSLISSVPAQTLHFYTLAHLNPSPPSALPLGITAPGPIIPPTPEILTALTTFYSHLAPPPKLHCVRCHRGYFELENGDTACRVAHDDESAIVQRVGTNSQNSRALHETLWGCCGSTVDGDGDQGPPDGWCYEGAHTTDVKRARFRADSTMQDDMLTSCAQMRCGMPPRSSASRSTRKRNRRAMEAEEEEEEDDAESVVSSTRTHTRTHSRSISISSAKGKGKMGPPAAGEEKDEEAKARPVKRARARKASISASKKDSEETKEDAMDVDDDNNVSPPSPPKSPKCSRKTSTTSAPNDKPRKSSAPPSPKPKPKARSPAKPTSKSSTGTAPIQRSPLSASFVPASTDSSVIQVRPESPIRKPRGRVEVEIVSRSPPKGGVLSKASVSSLRAQASMSSLRGGSTRTTKPLREVVDTSVDGEGWS
ncbi:hypothetical protein D9619_000730 [Psilocybe cf. subviscida]|uniref:Uncharacterized protein n=1 Tax=Psilocybe cf. subviscida TaxID=2480587 RepID=A0A8H5BFD2_9AGAR|nr:hypothetical protein D9619_000730 [Psilocybe cf. subviscida]